jgi:peptidoglycan/LPS O-acetylase OafA/YrhL
MKATHLYLLLTWIGALLYDIYAYIKLGDGNTISEIIWRYSKDYPILPFLGGLLAAHFWWTKRNGGGLPPAVLVGLGLGLLALNLYIVPFNGKLPDVVVRGWLWLRYHQYVPFLIGAVCGRYCWVQ